LSIFINRGKMKTTVGIIKKIDNLGRIVIPKDFRERFDLTEYVEIITTEFGVMLRNPEYKLVKVDNDEHNDMNN